ncbi:hypothetical protein PLESTF_001835500 [Pleodorina starrii]|nr:hypothetical protein PLESTF_001835500 [Pleodorina starrii]
MFFFFVGGVYPKVKVLRSLAERCVNCGSQALREERLDQSLHIFFLPVWTLSKGTPYITCGACGWTSAEGPMPLPPPAAPPPRLTPRPGGVCPSCYRPVEPDFAFCPSCGCSLTR